jgi:hypothetical protein
MALRAFSWEADVLTADGGSRMIGSVADSELSNRESVRYVLIDDHP